MRLRQGIAQSAMVHLRCRLGQCLRHVQRAFAVMLQQVKRHALRRLHAHAWQSAQSLYQRVKGVVISH